jgi:hypothetical protein
MKSSIEDAKLFRTIINVAVIIAEAATIRVQLDVGIIRILNISGYNTARMVVYHRAGHSVVNLTVEADKLYHRKRSYERYRKIV